MPCGGMLDCLVRDSWLILVGLGMKMVKVCIRLVFIANYVFCVYLCAFHVSLLDCLGLMLKYVELKWKKRLDFEFSKFEITRLSFPFSLPESFSHFLALLSRSLAANFRLNKFPIFLLCVNV